MNKFQNKKILNRVLKKEFFKRTFSFQEKLVCSVFSQRNSLQVIQTSHQSFLGFEPRHAKVSFGFKNFCDQKFFTSDPESVLFKQKFKTKVAFKKENTIFLSSFKNQKLFYLFAGRENSRPDPIFFNFAFDKNRLKSVVAWFLERYGQYKTIQFLEKLKEFGFGYATKGGLSLGIDDLKIPNNKIALIAKAETKVSKDLMDFRNAKITGVERMQRLIYTWNQTNDMLKQEVIKYFETIDLFNPIYMMAFSGARGNMSQVRQLVGMRGLMSDPQGQIIDFPIQSNFREGLTLTEYLISTYGARKGIVDTALRTATAGYLTRRLVDVAQHVIVSLFDCETLRGIFLFDMKEANKTIYSFQNRLVGRVLAQDIISTKEINKISERKLIASRNQEIDSKLAFAISKVTKKALVRSPLTCETPRLICQLCYGWSLSQGKLVSVGEAVGVIAAQSIGEPGTQLTMRTFHTGGVFAGGLTDQILAPFDGKIQYFHNIPGSCIRISLSEIAFFTKTPGSFFVIRSSKNQENILDYSFTPHLDETYLFQVENDWKQKNKNSNFSEIYKIPAYAVLFLRNHEFVQKKQVLAQFSTVAKKQLQYGNAEQTLYSILAGEFYLSTSSVPFQKKDQFTRAAHKIHLLVETRSSDSFDLSPLELKNDIIWKVKDWTNLWILSGKVLYNSFDSTLFIKNGDFLKKTTPLNRILWKKTKTWNLFGFQNDDDLQKKKKRNMLYSMALENSKNSQKKDFFPQKFLSSSSYAARVKLKSTFHQNIVVFPCFSLSFQQNKKMKSSLFNVWKTSLKQINFTFFLLCKKKSSARKHMFKENKKSFEKKNFTWKIFFDASKNKHLLEFHLFPFQPFSSNFTNSYKKQKQKNQKFLKPKKDIIFSGNFQRFFIFSQKQKKFKKQNQENLNSFFYKRKNPLKQIFFKFSTFARISPFFRIYHFAKKFNTSQKFVKRTSFSCAARIKLFSEKRYLLSKFLWSKKYSTKIFYRSEQSFKKVRSVQFPKIQKDVFYFKTKAKSKIFSLQSLNQSFEKVFSSKKQNPNFVFSTSRVKFPFLNALKLLHDLKNGNNFSQIDHFEKTTSQQIILKKTLFYFQYKKVRYKKFGYLFSFFDSSKSQQHKNSQFSFQTFTTLKQTLFDENKRANLGKQQTGISIANENFFGKDIPTFLSYCFPKNYETLTNGIFTILAFENFSKKQKFTQFLCFNEKSLFDFSKSLKVIKNQNKKDHRKKSNFLFEPQKATFFTFSPFSFVLQNKSAFSSNLFSVQKTKNVFKDSWKRNFKQKELSKNFLLNLQKRKISDFNYLSSVFLFGLKKSKNKSTFNRFFNSEIYTEEIFWIPQENYTFSVLNFSKRNQNIFPVKAHENFTFFLQSKKKSSACKHQEVQDKIKGYVSHIIFKKTPLFYSSNRQGKKKLFFPLFEGIWNCSTFSNQIKYQQSSSFKKKSVFPKNFKILQQKISFYQNQNKKFQNQRKISLPFFYSFKKHKKRKYVQKLSFRKNSSMRFLQWKFFLQHFSKTKIARKKSFHARCTFKQKNFCFFKFSPKLYFSKEFNKEFKTNISALFKDKRKKSNFQKSQKLFQKLQQSTFLKRAQIQAKVGQLVHSNCLTCLPLQKSIQHSILSSQNFVNHFENQFQEHDLFVPSCNTNFESSHSNEFKISKIECKQMHITIQSGWLCVFGNSSFVLNSHQTTAKQGHFLTKDLCFEQNKIFKEAILLKASTVCSKFQTVLFKQPSLNSGSQPFKNKSNDFSVQFLKRNSNCRFQTNESFVALENFGLSFEEDQDFNKEKIFYDQLKRPIQRIGFAPELLKMDSKLSKPTEKIALFIRPMHYKLLENPRNYKNSFLNTTIQKSSQKNSISFLSSLKIYKKYHSNILNCQKPQKSFLHHCKNVDLTVGSAFEKIHNLKKFRKTLVSRMLFPRTFKTNFVPSMRKNQSFFDFRLSKKDTLKKSLNFKLYSKKTLLSKFKNLLNRDFSKHFLQVKDQMQTLNLRKSSARFQEKVLKKNLQSNYFFSFYPIQFLPLFVSHSSWNNSPFHFKTSKTLPTLFLNAVNATLHFSICEKKAAFLNQRFVFFKKSFETAFFWLNKDGLKFVFPEVFAQKSSKNFWKQSFSLFLNTKKIERKKNQFVSIKIQPSKTTQIVQNFIFKKNPSFYANTKFLSPFEGELIPMYMNETNWWKKASEISTIQKFNTLFSVVPKKDLFALDFSKTSSQNIKRKNSQFLTLHQQNGKNQHYFENESKGKYSLQNKQCHLIELYRSVLKKQKIFEVVESFGIQKEKKDYSDQEQFFANSFKGGVSFAEEQKTPNLEIHSFSTKYENKLYTFKNLKIGYPKLSKKPTLGKFFVYGDCVLNLAIRKPGQIVHISSFKVTLRRAQPFLVSPKGILHLANTPYIQKNIPILTLPYQTVQSGDIVQGIPKVEQLFEARTTIQGRLFLSSLPILLKGIFERYKTMLPLEQAVRQSFLKIQQLIVDGVQRVYRSQGVSIIDKHLEVIVRQMTTKVQIIHGAQTGFFPGELVNLDLVERINKFLLVKIRYEPVVLGITRSSLEVHSFLSASSFQQTTKILALASISRKKDFLKGLKENILVGNLMPSGTGYMVLRKNL
uniref:RNA polymerase beta'' subunit n=1 Tax=Tetradesmus dimorphus TaxID=119574 RepID=UPI0030033033|nr:RNA polymerase beta'' subunit [Tetradesmus dimorphus]